MPPSYVNGWNTAIKTREINIITSHPYELKTRFHHQANGYSVSDKILGSCTIVGCHGFTSFLLEAKHQVDPLVQVFWHVLTLQRFLTLLKKITGIYTIHTGRRIMNINNTHNQNNITKNTTPEKWFPCCSCYLQPMAEELHLEPSFHLASSPNPD